MKPHKKHTSTILHDIWLPISFFIRFQTFTMGFMSREFPGNSRTGFPLQSMNILVLLELLHGTISCIKYIPSVGTQSIHMHFNIINNIALVYALSMLPFTFL